jgi:hypothetical protein
MRDFEGENIPALNTCIETERHPQEHWLSLDNLTGGN